MANLGQVMHVRPFHQVIWTYNPISSILIGEIIGQYATYGGYIYVK